MPPGDHVTHELLSAIGYMVSHHLYGDQAQPHHWYWWKGNADEDTVESDEDEKKRRAEHRAAIQSVTGR